MRRTDTIYSAHNHSNRSLLDALQSPEEVVQQAYDLGFKAVSLSEHGSLFSAVDGFKKAQELGIKYIPACEAYECLDIDEGKNTRNRFHLLLLAKNNKGYENINRIVTEGYQRGMDNFGYPRVDLATIAKYSEGVIGSSSCLGGRLNRLLSPDVACACCAEDTEGKDHQEHVKLAEAERWAEAKALVQEYKNVFKDGFYIELQSHNTIDQEKANKYLVRLAEETHTPYIVTFDSHMSGPDQLKLHDVFIGINPKRGNNKNRDDADVSVYEGCWQTSIDGIHEVMDSHIGSRRVAIAIANTDAIADMCNVTIDLHQDLMPHIKIPKGFDNDGAYLKYLVNQGWRKRKLHKMPKAERTRYKKRLQEEFEVLEYLGYSSYFIMLKQLIDKMQERKIPMGYSRGSGGNCLTLWVIGVTEVDSVRWNLDFTRFGNKGRKGSSADYDIDISKARRMEALEIAVELFGRGRIAHLCTFNSLSPKVCIRDIGKVLDERGVYVIPYKVRDEIAKHITGDDITQALINSAKLRKFAEQFPLLFEYTAALQNKPKSVGTHASAIAIADVDLVRFSPLMLSDEGYNILQLEMHNAQDDIGLIKMDFLGLETCDVVDSTLKFAGLTWEDIDLQTLDLEDQDVFREIFGKGNVLGIFQCEKEVPRQMGVDIRPNHVNDIFAICAMNRPAILQLGGDKIYIRNKHNPGGVEYVHLDLQDVFGETYGIMLYQEQCLAVFRMSGFPEEEVDTARRAVGKKKPEVMAALKGKLIDGLVAKGWTEGQADAIWGVIEAQADYSFNKGHTVAYGLLAYVTAYLKHHHPVAFMTALLTSEIGDYGQMTRYINECHRMGIVVMHPDINKSEIGFSVSDSKILFGLTAIRGVGESAVEQIKVGRPYASFADFVERCNLDQSTIVALIQAGCFGNDRDNVLMQYAMHLFQRRDYSPVKTIPTKAKLMEFGLIRSDAEFKDKVKCLELWNEHKANLHEAAQDEKYHKHLDAFQEKYQGSLAWYEYNTLSVYISDHPFKGLPEKYLHPFGSFGDGDKILVGGTISRVERKKQKDGKTMAYIDVLTMDPEHPLIEGMCFGDVFATYAPLIKRGSNVAVLAKKSGEQIIVNGMQTLEAWSQHLERLEAKKALKAS